MEGRWQGTGDAAWQGAAGARQPVAGGQGLIRRPGPPAPGVLVRVTRLPTAMASAMAFLSLCPKTVTRTHHVPAHPSTFAARWRRDGASRPSRDTTPTSPRRAPSIPRLVR